MNSFLRFSYLVIVHFVVVYSTTETETPKPVILRPTEILLTKTVETMTSVTSFTGETMCLKQDSKIILGLDANVKIRFVDTKDSATLADAFTIHQTISSGGNTGVTLKGDKTKSIIFTVSDSYKVLLVGPKEDDCFKNYLVTNEEKKNQYVHLTYIKCFPLDEVAAYMKKSASEDKKKYVLGTKHLCFLPSLVTEPICIEASDKTRSYTIIISPYPSPETKCTTTTTSKPCPVAPANATTNGTETAKQSAAPIIISVVVIVVVIIAGGVGYVMMKK